MTDDEQGEIERSRQGDAEAFASLVRRYQRMIYALTYRMSGSAAEAEDLTQETFIRAHQQLGAYRAEAKFSSWLYRIAINHCLNWRQRVARREELQNQWQQDQQLHSAPTASGRHEKVQAALMQLPPKQRAAVALTIYDGLSHAEAARVLGCSETTVSWRLFAARHKLKRLLKHVATGGDAHEE